MKKNKIIKIKTVQEYFEEWYKKQTLLGKIKFKFWYFIVIIWIRVEFLKYYYSRSNRKIK